MKTSSIIIKIGAFWVWYMYVSQVVAQERPIPIYGKEIPNSRIALSNYHEINENNKIGFVSIPMLIPFIPNKANGTAIIICPGGGYARLMIENEGFEVARKFNQIGVTAFVLKYRLPSDSIMIDKSIGPLQDAQRSIQLLREQARDWHIDPSKIGIIGFSAGGHLASTAGTHFHYPLIDNPKDISLRPDFMMLIYPVITFGEFTHKGSKHYLLGDHPDQQTVELFSNERQVTANTPITFILQAQDDRTVPVKNSLLFYQALTEAGVKAELLLFPSGGHGFGLKIKGSEDDWFESAIHWLDNNGLLQKNTH